MIKWLIPWMLAAHIHANEFPVVIGNSAYTNMPGLAERIVKELNNQGLNATLKVVPGDRALYLLKHGHSALDIIRHPKVVEGYTQLTQVKPAVNNIQFVRIVSSEKKENCTDAGGDLSIIGVKGIRIFNGVITPKFKSIIWVPNEDIAFNMISLKRGDMTYWLKNGLSTVKNTYSETLTVCTENEVAIPLYSYVHEDYEWALKKVEAAYAKLFGEKSDGHDLSL